MTSATIAKEYNALPWYGASMVVFEFAAGGQDTNTIEMATRGFTSVRACLGFDSTAKIVANGGSVVASNTTLVTVAGSTVLTLIVIGR